MTEYYFDYATGHEYMVNGDCWEDLTTGEYGLFNKSTGTGCNLKTGEDFIFSGNSFETDSGRSGLINPQSTDYSHEYDSSASSYSSPSSTNDNLSSTSSYSNGNAELFNMLRSFRYIRKPQSKTAKVMVWLFIKIPLICYFLLIFSYVFIYFLSLVLQ